MPLAIVPLVDLVLPRICRVFGLVTSTGGEDWEEVRAGVGGGGVGVEEMVGV